VAAEPTWLFARASSSFARQRADVRRWWTDAAGGRIDGRYLATYERRATATVAALEQQSSAIVTADAAAKQANDAASGVRDALEAAIQWSARAAEGRRTAEEHLVHGSEAAKQASQLLQQALDTVGRAGAACGEGVTTGSELRKGFEAQLPSRDPAADQLLAETGRALEVLSEPFEEQIGRLAGQLAGTAVGAGLAVGSVLLADPTVRALLQPGSERDAELRLLRRRVHRARGRLNALAGRR
jgi:hypothetical protein